MMTSVAFVGLFLAVGFAAFALGLWTYAEIYRGFLARVEDEHKRKVSTLTLQSRQREARVRDMAERLKAAYMSEFPEKQEEAQAEIERILENGPAGG